MGGVGGLGMVLITQPDDDAAIATILVGSIAGLLLGAGLTEGDSGEEDPSDDPQAAGALPASGALVSWSRGEWSLLAPLPFPVRAPCQGGGGAAGAGLEGAAAERAVLTPQSFSLSPSGGFHSVNPGKRRPQVLP